jgi:glycosyltransferase involved in cell wall biosynthesis
MVAARLHSQHGVPWIADYRDLWSVDPVLDYPRWYTIPEPRTIASAALATTVSDHYVCLLSDAFGGRVEMVRNGFDPVLPLPLSQRERLSRSKLNLLHTGSTFYGSQRDPSALFQAAVALGLTREELTIHFLGVEGLSARHVAELAVRHGASHLVQLHGPVGHESALQWQTRADALLLLQMRGKEAGIGTYPGKFFEYLAARRPILCLGYPLGPTPRLIAERGLGYVVSDVAGTADALQRMLADVPPQGLSPDLPAELSADFSRAEQNARMLELLLEVAGSSG